MQHLANWPWGTSCLVDLCVLLNHGAVAQQLGASNPMHITHAALFVVASITGKSKSRMPDMRGRVEVVQMDME